MKKKLIDFVVDSPSNTFNCTTEKTHEGLEVTHTAGQAGVVFDFPSGIALDGKYITMMAKEHNNANAANIKIELYAGDPVNEDFYYFWINSDRDNFLTGWNGFDRHINLFETAGSPANLENITRIRILIEGANNRKVTLRYFDVERRKPWLVFVQDGPRRSFNDDVRPLLDARGLPYTVLSSQEITNDYMTGGGYKSLTPLKEYRRILAQENAIGGLHIDCQHSTFGEFKEKALEQFANSRKLGLWDENEPLHICALQNDYVHADRYRLLKNYGQTMRWGHAIPQENDTTSWNGYNYILPASNASFGSLRVKEFDHLVTEETILEWLGTAIENEVGLYVFGHGTCRDRETNCTSVDFYQAFFEEYDRFRHKIDFISTSELYNRYKNTRRYLDRKIPSNVLNEPLFS